MRGKYFRCRKRYFTAGSKFYLSRYCFFSRCQERKWTVFFEFLGYHQIPASYSVVFPSLSRNQMQICAQIIYKDKHVCRNIRLAGNLNVFCSGLLRPSNFFALGQEDILLHQYFYMQHICNISYSFFYSLWGTLLKKKLTYKFYFFFGWV